MYKKLMLACMAIAAFAAFVIAPAASASPVLTETTTGGPALAVGSSITGKNTGNTVFSGSGLTIECSNADLKGTLTKNNGTEIAGEIPAGSASFTGTGTSGDCTSNLGSASATVNSALCMATIPKTDNVTVTGCSGKSVEFTLSVTGTGNCKYASATVTGTFLTNADATVKITNQGAKKVEGGIFCPGEGVLNMDFDLQTTAGTTIYVS
jgi:hypothetical protein